MVKMLAWNRNTMVCVVNWFASPKRCDICLDSRSIPGGKILEFGIIKRGVFGNAVPLCRACVTDIMQVFTSLEARLRESENDDPT